MLGYLLVGRGDMIFTHVTPVRIRNPVPVGLSVTRQKLSKKTCGSSSGVGRLGETHMETDVRFIHHKQNRSVAEWSKAVVSKTTKS